MATASPSRVVLLTGAAGGLGSVMTAALLADGHSVAAHDRDAAGLARLRDRHGDIPSRLHVLEGDVAGEADCSRAVAATVERFGRLDVLVNNAGIGVSLLRPDAWERRPTLEELTPDWWERFFAVNVHGAYRMARHAAPHMKAAGWGRIVNVTTSFFTMLRVLPYGATKAALECMAAVWAEELRPYGVTVNVLVPGGPADTPMLGDSYDRAKVIRPEVMGPPLAWLCSPAADGVTGRRVIAANWDPTLEPQDAADRAGAPIGWPELAASTVVWPTD